MNSSLERLLTSVTVEVLRVVLKTRVTFPPHLWRQQQLSCRRTDAFSRPARTARTFFARFSKTIILIISLFDFIISLFDCYPY